MENRTFSEVIDVNWESASVTQGLISSLAESRGINISTFVTTVVKEESRLWRVALTKLFQFLSFAFH